MSTGLGDRWDSCGTTCSTVGAGTGPLTRRCPPDLPDAQPAPPSTMEDAMGDAPAPERLFVSLQAPMPQGTAIEAHRAAGTLLSPELVLVSRLPLELVRQAHTFHVLIVGAPGVEGRAVERLAIAYVEAHGLDGDDSCELVAELARPSSFRVSTGATIRSGDLAKSLQASGGDAWRSLRELRAAGPGIPDVAAEEALAELPAANLRAGAPEARVVLHDDIDLVAWSLCNWVPGCHPRRPDRLDP
jgi:hypothetical protein